MSNNKMTPSDASRIQSTQVSFPSLTLSKVESPLSLGQVTDSSVDLLQATGEAKYPRMALPLVLSRLLLTTSRAAPSVEVAARRRAVAEASLEAAAAEEEREAEEGARSSGGALKV